MPAKDPRMPVTQPVYDPAWLDDQYNNRTRIPEHPQIFERWRRESAQSREKATCLLDLAYGEAPGETLDVFPAAVEESPVLVFIHGGWWRAFSKSDHSFIAPSFVEDGAMVVLPDYALCPAVTIEQIALQMVRALAWTWRNAARYGGDARRIVVAGHSAGGHLATMLLCCDWSQVDAALPERPVQGALSISGLYDLEPLRQTAFLNVDLRLTPEAVRRLSPALFPPPQAPLHAVAGALESEEFRRQTALIRQVWGAKAVPVCETIPGMHHLGVLHDLADPAGRSHRLARQLLGLE
jgi:arylformamidase